jgi:hypothetical protein
LALPKRERQNTPIGGCTAPNSTKLSNIDQVFLLVWRVVYVECVEPFQDLECFFLLLCDIIPLIMADDKDEQPVEGVIYQVSGVNHDRIDAIWTPMGIKDWPVIGRIIRRDLEEFLREQSQLLPAEAGSLDRD